MSEFEAVIYVRPVLRLVSPVCLPDYGEMRRRAVRLRMNKRARLTGAELQVIEIAVRLPEIQVIEHRLSAILQNHLGEW